MRFIKISATGEELPDDATEWSAVKDAKRKLMWSVAEMDVMTHPEALQAVAALTTSGFTDWRLPSIEQLFLLANRKRHSPAIDTAYFPHCRSEWYWAATRHVQNPASHAWMVNFLDGFAAWGGRESNDYGVRAMRVSR